MQPGSPYHLIEAVGSCQVGSVWSAIDPQGRSLMVALLDPNVATDQRWREAFQEAANALVQAGEPSYLYADFASGSPWVAYAAENGVGAERVFLALGMDFQPVPPDGLGPLDYTPIEPTTQITKPATPPPPAPEQPLPPGVIDATTPAEPPTTVLPPAQPGPPATESAEAVAAQPSPAAPEAPAPAATADDATQATQGVAPPAAPSPIPPAPVSPWNGQQYPVSPPPQQSIPVSAPPPVSGAPHPTSGAPRPVSGTPMSPAYGQPLSPAYGTPAPAYGPRPPQGPAPYDPYAPVAPPPRRSRTGLWVGVAVAVLVLIAGGGGVYAWSSSGDNPNPPERTNAATEAPLPTATPLSPGVEPPEDGNWSTSWPRFADPPDKVRQMNLEGIGFNFLVPRDWECQLGGSGDGFVKYNCGGAPGGPEIGGEIVVRECPPSCDETRRLAMRKAEEAWGLRWKRGSRTSAYAETNEIDGQPRYGLVIVAYFRSSPDQAIDRQLVFRMTAPVEQADVIRKISRSVRTSAPF
jgi:hypothetical protein